MEEKEPFVRSFRYGPDGQAQIFDSAEDVPEGWEDHPSKVKGAAKPDEPGEKRLPRPELMEALRQRGVQFAPNAGGAELAALLAASEPQPVQVDSNGKALGMNRPEPNDKLAGLEGINEARRLYRAKFKKNPGPRWDEATIRAKLED